jgi:hypothetical protein
VAPMNEKLPPKPRLKPVQRQGWTEWHLTPRGWEIGSIRRTGEATTWRDEPEDRLLSCVYRERSSAADAHPDSHPDQHLDAPTISASKEASREESWRTKDSAKLGILEECLMRFGPTPPGLKE